jgi:hypothetical protein
MNGYTFKELQRTLAVLNWHYGRGDVIEVRSLDNGRGLFVRKSPHCREETRNFRLVGHTLYALGHQRKVRVINSAV